MAGPARFHSRTFAVLRAVHNELSGVAFPALQGSTPKLIFGDPFGVQDGAREIIGVVLTVDNNRAGWDRMPGGREETFDVNIIIRSELLGRTGPQVLDRLDELTELVESVFYDTSRAQPNVLPVDGVTNLTLISSVRPDVRADAEGFVGAVDVVVSFNCRI
jgi:hypothetical protein